MEQCRQTFHLFAVSEKGFSLLQIMVLIFAMQSIPSDISSTSICADYRCIYNQQTILKYILGNFSSTFVAGFDKARLHTSNFIGLKIHNSKQNYATSFKFYLLFYEHMTKLSENSRPKHDVTLNYVQLIEVEEFNVCGSLVQSNRSSFFLAIQPFQKFHMYLHLHNLYLIFALYPCNDTFLAYTTWDQWVWC